MNKSILILISTALVLNGCGNGHNHTEDHDHSTHEAETKEASTQTEAETEKGHSEEIIFSPEQRKGVDFALYKVTPSTFHEVIPASGQILSAQGDEATLVAPVSGIISFSAKTLSEGAAVRKGEVLFHISSKRIAEGDYTARTRAAYQQAKAAYERASELIKDRIITQTEYEQARLAYENARTAQEALAGSSSAQGTSATAPISGFVKNISVAEGAYVEVGQPLATLSQNRRLQLRADVSQKYLGTLSRITGANFRTPYDTMTYTLSNMGGRLLSTGKSSDGLSAYIPVTFEFDNRGSVVPGASVEVFLLSSPIQGALTVPLSALIEEQGSYFVFVQLDEEGFRKQEVKLGAQDGKQVQIIAGLHAGDTVVSRGAYRVKMASFSGEIPHGHTH